MLLLIRICLSILLFAAICMPQASFASEKSPLPYLTMCIDHYPPLQVVLEDGQATGLNVELTRAFFKKLGYQLRFTTDIPFRRCLQWLKEGEVDVMAGLLGSEDRHRDFHMFLYDGHTVKTFFTQKNGPNINRFADLRGMNIAVVRGSRQFEQFDNAPESMFTKTIVNSLVAAFGMLSKGRVDAVVSTDYYGDNIIKNNPDYLNTLVQASYEEINGTKVYIGLSRQSKYAFEAQRFNNLAIEMYLSGEFDEITKKHQSQYSEYF